MGKKISKTNENGKGFSESLFQVIKSMKNIDKAAKDVLLLEKNQTFLNNYKKFDKSDKFTSSLDFMLNSNQSVLLSLDFLSLYFSEVLFKYNISAYNTINFHHQTEAFEGEGSRWGYEILNINESQDIWSQFDKILPELKNDLLRDFDDYSSIHENSDIKEDEISKFSENISQNQSCNIDNSPKRRGGSSSSFKKVVQKREGLKSQVANKSFPIKNGIKRSDNISKFSQNLKLLQTREYLVNPNNNQSKMKNINKEGGKRKNTNGNEVERKSPKTSNKINNIDCGNTFKKNDRIMSLKSIKPTKTLKKETFKSKLSQVFDSRNKDLIRNKMAKNRKKTDLKSNKSQASLESKNQNVSPLSKINVNKDKLNAYIIEKSKVLSIEKKCKKHKNIKSKKSIEDENLNIKEKNYIRIDLRVLEKELLETDPLNIFRIEKMKINDDETQDYTKSPMYNNDKTTPVTQALSYGSDNKLKFAPIDLNTPNTFNKGKSFLSDKNTIISKDKLLHSSYNKSEKTITYKKLLKSFQRENNYNPNTNFKEDFDSFKCAEENTNNPSSSKFKNVNKNRKTTSNLTKSNVFNKYFNDEINFPNYNLDLTPLRYDLPYNHVVKLYKNNNDFLFKNTSEDKYLMKTLKKLNLESFEQDNLC